MKLYLFDDRVADGWHPFSLTRPAGELLFGAWLLRERLERWAGRPVTAALTRPWLASYREAGAPAAVPRDPPPSAHERLLLCSRFVPAPGDHFAGRGPRSILLLTRNGVAGCYLPPEQPGPDAEWLESPSPEAPGPGWETVDAGGSLLEAAWDLVAANSTMLRQDLADDQRSRDVGEDLPAGAHRVGQHAVRLGKDTVVEPGVVFDTRSGPVSLAEGVEVRAGCRIAGPFMAGPRTRLLGGSFGRVSAGPECRLRGEIEDSVVLGYSNKAHEGFLGHSYIGRWVNIGAATTNSDLKNTYGPIRVGTPRGDVDSTLTKLGCLLGDHVKTAIGTRIYAGTVVGAGSNLVGDSVPPRWVPPFTWGSVDGAAVYERSRFIEVACRVAQRRGIEMDETMKEWLGDCWDAREAD